MRALAATLALALVSAAAAAPPSARGAQGDYCVRTVRAGCAPAGSVAEALAARDRVRVFVGSGSFTGQALTDGGRAVEVVGAGTSETVMAALRLDSSGSKVTGVAFTGRLRVAGRAEAVAPRAGVDLVAGQSAATVAQLARSVVDGGVRATGPAQLDSVVLRSGGSMAAALVADCATVLARGLTISGAAPHAVRAGCATAGASARAELRSSVLGGSDPVAVAAGGSVATAYSAHADDPDAAATARLQPGSVLVDAGDPGPLAPFEPFEDAAGDTRVTDGDGDGVLRRDVGAYERQPAPIPDAPGNVLVNGGAEDAEQSPPAPPAGWTGTFVAARYGEPFLPGTQAAAALGAGRRFFSAGEAEAARLLQRIDVTASAAAVDGGAATAALSGLLGGYGDDGDRVRVTATYRDPEGARLGALAIGPVTADERLKDTNLLARMTGGPIPPRTRAIDVTVLGERRAGSYTDAYADRLALVLSVPGAAVEPPVQAGDPIVRGLKPFAGVSVLTAHPAFGRRWRAAVAVACPSSTVGRCSARLELRARLPRARRGVRIAPLAGVTARPGRVRSAVLRMRRPARRALRGRRRLRARLVAVASDRQGVQRTRIVPVRLALPGA